MPRANPSHYRAERFEGALQEENPALKIIWEPFPSPTTEDLSQIIMTSSTRGWIVALGAGKLFEFDGRAWRDITPLGEKVFRIHALAQNDVWYSFQEIDSYRWKLKHFDGRRWTTFDTPNADEIYSMDFVSPSDGWAVCAWGEVLH